MQDPLTRVVLRSALYKVCCAPAFRDGLVARSLVDHFLRSGSSWGGSKISAAWVLGVSVATIYRRLDLILDRELAAQFYERAAGGYSETVEHHVNNMVAS